ncbi:MAG: heavy metal translocating P-type ATPase [Halolamina sp.]
MSDSAGPGDERRDGEASHDTASLRLSVPTMDCASCAEKVERGVSDVPGVETVDPRPTTGTLVVAYDPPTTGPAAIRDAVEGAGYGVEGERTTFTVPSMDCPSCAGKVEGALEETAGVTEVETQPATGKATVSYREPADAATLSVAIEDAGYEVTDRSSDGEGGVPAGENVWRSSRAIKTWIGGVLTLAGLLVQFLVTGLDADLLALGTSVVSVADALFLLAVVASGQEIVRGGYYSLRGRSLDIDLLMSTAIAGALAASLVFGEALYMEAATLAVLFSVAELLETYSMDRARQSLRELMELSPDRATVRRDGEEIEVDVEELDVGDTVVVRPGEKLPADGEVTRGESAVDQSPITGESVPVEKAEGDEVYAGTINETGALDVEVSAAAGDDTLSQVVELVEDAQANQTEHERFVERFADRYTPVVVVAAILTAAIPPLAFSAPVTPWFVNGLTLLVLACPCAFVIATPVTVVSGITSAAKNGVLVKGGNHLEAMGEVEAVALDKTGTLTLGELSVTDTLALGDATESVLLATAAALEARSEHPIGEAIVESAAEADVDAPEVANFESITGKGVRADIDGVTHYAGKPSLFEELGFDLSHTHATTDGGVTVEPPAEPCDREGCLDLEAGTVRELQSQGKTVILVGTERRLLGLIAVADQTREEAAWTVEALHERGIEEVVMLTGDNERTAAAIAAELGVDDYRAELLPAGKVDAIETLREEYDGVAMVGDGVNDAPALAAATVGIAMGAAGTDTALETADVALMGDRLDRLPYLHELSQSATAVIRQNIGSSLGAKALLAAGVPFGLVPIWAAVLVGDAGLTTVVTANAMRLAGIEPDR